MGKMIEVVMKVGDIFPGCIFMVNKDNYYNEDGSFTIIRGSKKLILKKSLFEVYLPKVKKYSDEEEG
jgi:hypothetical protein